MYSRYITGGGTNVEHEVKNRECPVCAESGRDSTGDHLWLMADKARWFCNKVDAHPDGQLVFFDNSLETNEPIFEDEGGEPKETPQEPPHDMFGTGNTNIPLSDYTNREGAFKPPQSTTVCEDFRGVPAEWWEKYGVEFSKVDGELVRQFYPVTLNGKLRTRKIRIIEDKEFYWEDKKKAKKKDLFGMLTVPDKIPKRVLLTEGEIDAVSAAYMLEKYKVVVLSGMDGDSIKNIAQNTEFLEKIPILTLCPDQDVPGNEFCEKIVSLFPEILVMDIARKDANAMLEVGLKREFTSAYFDAGKYKPPSIVEVSSFADCLRTPVAKGISYPWPSLDAITYGMLPHTILSIGSGPSVGKTTLVRAIQEHLMFHHGVPIGIFSLEESKETTLRFLVGYRMNQRIHLPGSKYDIDEAISYAEELEGKAFIYDRRYFNGNWEKIEKSIRFMYAMGVKHFFIDPLTALVVHHDSSTQNTALGKIMSDLSTLMQELPIYVMLVNHLNNPSSGPGHDEGGRVLPSQFTGSKSQWRFSTDMWGIERNILSEDEEEKNTMTIRNLKHRTDGSLMGRTTRFNFSFDSGRLLEKPSGFKSGTCSLTIDKAPLLFPDVSQKHSNEVTDGEIYSKVGEFKGGGKSPVEIFKEDIEEKKPETITDLFGGGA
jgi:twinkle protein